MNRDQPSRRMDEPQPCYVKLKRIRNGPYVGARIFLRLGMLAGEINGEVADVFEIWHAGELIDEERYNILMEPPLLNPWTPVYLSDAGLTDRAREAEEQLWLERRPIT